MEEKLEVCVCAAIKLADGVVIRGKRHGDCLAVIRDLEFSHIGSVQGFMTSFGRFVDRKEGRQLQNTAKIPSAAPFGYTGDILFSEDLY